MADLYRKSLLDKLSNPEQLDKMIKISSPLSWLALVAVLLIIVATAVWSVFGTLPTTETVTGIIVDSNSVNSVYSEASGTLQNYAKEVGDDVKKGDTIATIKLSDGTTKNINADCDGWLSVCPLEVGMPVFVGMEVARITPQNLGSQVLVCYVPFAYAQKFTAGMDVLVYPSSIDSQKYGHMAAEIVSVDKYATNVDSLAYLLGSGNMVAEQIVANGPVVSIVCKIKTDTATQSGYYWSSDRAKNLTISNNTTVSATIITDRCAPITKLLGDFRDDTEG